MTKEKMMRSRFNISLACGLLVAVCAAAAAVIAQEKKDPAHKSEKPTATNPAFDKLKSLAGTWVGEITEGEKHDEKGPADVTVVYKVTSAGSAVIETLFPGTPHEMVTMYHLDGDNIVLTHYCALGNQPHMKAEKSADANKLVFKFVSGCNVDPAKDPHMHDLTHTFVDADHLRSEWTYWAGGKQTDTTKFDVKRKKD